MRTQNSKAFQLGIRHGIPIMLGYLAVSFALGISARNAGLNALQAGVASLTNMASAGEYAGFQVIRERSGLAEAALMTLIANARYLLMSCALSQKLAEDLRAPHRLLLGMTVTDEMFALSVAQPGKLNPWYPYGMFTVSATGWTLGTVLGVIVGNALPQRLVSALSVSLFGMFLAAIVPKAKTDRTVLVLIAVSMALSGLASVLPGIGGWSSGMRVILLTVLIAGTAAVIRPVREENADEP